MLTQKKIEAAKPLGKLYKLADQDGLYLAVTPAGGKSWRYNHAQGGKQQTKTYGRWPAMSLADARAAHAAFQDAPDTAPTFRAVAEDWLRIKLPTLSNPKHQHQTRETLERHVFPEIGDKPIDQIKRVKLVEVVKAVDALGITETAHRVAGRIGMVFAYAQDCGIIEANPATGLTRVLSPRKVKQHMPCIHPREAKQLMQDIDNYGEEVTRLGLKLLALTFARVGELRGMRWDEIDGSFWVVPEYRMKMGKPHVVPLSSQALAVLDRLRQINGDSELVLDSPERQGHSLSENTFLFALYRLGYRGRMTAHGFRALASTVLNEQSQFSKDAIERQLAHKETDAVRAAYHRAEYLEERVKMMGWWGAWLE